MTQARTTEAERLAARKIVKALAGLTFAEGHAALRLAEALLKQQAARALARHGVKP